MAPRGDDGIDDSETGRLFAGHLLDHQSAGAAGFWTELTTGQLVVWSSFCAGGRCVGLVRRALPCEVEPRRLTQRERVFFELALSGQSQKAIAIDFGLSPSTVATILGTCWSKLGIDRALESVPLILILLEQARASTALELWTSRHPSDAEGTVVSLPFPDAFRLDTLTTAESAVVSYLIEGRSQREIADLRHACPRTVVNQLAAARRKLGASNRIELVRKVAEFSVR